jgi:hypothetical protein
LIHALIYHGWPVTEPVTIRERAVFHSLINQIDRAYPEEKNLVINATWLGWDFQKDCDALLQSFTPTQVWIGSLVDPPDLPDEWAKNKFPNSKINYFGYTSDHRFWFDFLALYCRLEIMSYTEQELMLQDDPNVFLCYQKKARPHRQLLTSKILSGGLDSYGKITLGSWREGYSYANLKQILDPSEVGHVPNGYSIYSIGNLQNWNKSLIHIVSESEPINCNTMFITEKTWRPILGLRPFVIYGDSRIYDYLKDNQFDTFDDLFPVQQLRKAVDMEAMSNIVVEILQHYSKLDPQQLKKIYVDLLPRLRANKKQFEIFATKQQHKIDNFFE